MQTAKTNSTDLMQAKRKIHILKITAFILILLSSFLGYLWMSTPKNNFANFSKQKKEEYLKAILGGEISVKTATDQLSAFIDKRDKNLLNSTNMPLAVCFTTKEIIAFLNKVYGYNLDLTQIPDDTHGVAFIFGMSSKTDSRKDKGTVMLVSTEYTESTPPNGHVELNNKVVKLASTFSTSAYDIGSIYP